MKHLPLLLLFFIPTEGFNQSREQELKQVLDSTISRSKEISYYSNQVNWDSLSTSVHDKAEGAKTLDDLKPAFQTLINGMGDPHGTIRKTANYAILGNFTDHKNNPKKDVRKFNQDIWQTVNNPDSRFEHALLPDGTGYLKVVGIGPQVDGQKEAERIRAAVQELKDKKVDNWILDLRYNGGGNINVMIAGLAPLFDTKVVASIQDGEKNTIGTAEVRKGDFYYMDFKMFEMPKKPKIKGPKIAVLLSRWTVSSGELLAVAFKGQKNTRFFGEFSGGLTTNNSWEVINNEIALIISTGVYCDRNGKSYPGFVQVDEEVPFEVETDKNKDAGIKKAQQWLKGS